MSEERAQSVDATRQSILSKRKNENRTPLSGSMFKKNGSTIQSLDQKSASGTRKSVQILLNSADINRKSKKRIEEARKKLLNDPNDDLENKVILVQNDSP